MTICVSGKEEAGLAVFQKNMSAAGHSSISICLKLLPYFFSFIVMAFNGKYELESQENYEEFLKEIGIYKIRLLIIITDITIYSDKHKLSFF